MPNAPHIFADRLLNLTLTGPILRIELGTLQAPTAEGEKPQAVVNQTLVMPLDGFLASFGMMEAMVKKMLADGVIKARPRDDAGQAS